MSVEPVRAQPRLHECVCVLVHTEAHQPGVEVEVRDSCHQAVSPDQPFCDDCIKYSHHLQPGNRERLRTMVREPNRTP